MVDESANVKLRSMLASRCLVILAVLFTTSCVGDRGGNTNAIANKNTNTTSAASSDTARFVVAEPERYSLVLNLGGNETGEATQPSSSGNAAPHANANAPHALTGNRPNNSATNTVSRNKNATRNGKAVEVIVVNPTDVSQSQLRLDKLGGDRRWSLKIAGLGSVVYLEKSGLKYLVLFDRMRYLEVSPSDLGFDAGRLLNPVAAALEYLAHWSYEGLGMEQVGVRAAAKYKFARAVNDPTGPRVKCFISIDQETRLPIRFEIGAETDSGVPPKSLLEAVELKLNPSATLFDVPAGMTKIKTENAKAQIQVFANAARRFAEALNPPQLAAQPNQNANRPTNANLKSAPTDSAGNGNKRAGSANVSRNKKGAILTK